VVRAMDYSHRVVLRSKISSFVTWQGIILIEIYPS
jgi:hypothetical protein